MLNIYPSYYKKFKCIADKCPDSCCKEWDVVVDEDSVELYGAVKGAIGKRLRSEMTVDDDGDTIFISKNNRCPFWNKSGLCDIITELGEDYLCETCREFPRLTLDYTAFCEHMISFACPEAARLILSEDNAYKSFQNYELDFENSGYSPELMNFLLKIRAQLAEILNNSSISFSKRLDYCFELCKDIQLQLDNSVSTYKRNSKEIFEIHKEFEFLSGEWRETVYKCADICETVKISEKYDDKFQKLALYYLYRYFLTAVDSLSIFSTLNRILFAYEVIGTALSVNDNFEELARIYSKEVEHSSENIKYFI